MVAAFPLNRQRLAVREPIDPRHIDVGVAAQVDPRDRPGLHIAHAEPDPNIGAAGGRVALGKGRDIVGGDLKALGDFHRRFVDAGEGYVAVIRRPPVAGVAVHLFLSDELGHAILDGPAAIDRQRLSLALGDVVDMQILIADEGHIAAGRRDGRIRGGTRRVIDFRHALGRGLPEIAVVELAAERK